MAGQLLKDEIALRCTAENELTMLWSDLGSMRVRRHCTETHISHSINQQLLLKSGLPKKLQCLQPRDADFALSDLVPSCGQHGVHLWIEDFRVLLMSGSREFVPRPLQRASFPQAASHCSGLPQPKSV